MRFAPADVGRLTEQPSWVHTDDSATNSVCEARILMTLRPLLLLSKRCETAPPGLRSALCVTSSVTLLGVDVVGCVFDAEGLWQESSMVAIVADHSATPNADAPC
jgi:hypothetical protein